VVRLFAAMLGIQVAIGALNDVVDAPLDAIAKPRKPIPSGLVGRRPATVVALGGAVIGIGLSAPSGVGAAVAAAACLGLGWLYDLRLSRTSWSWLPLSIALPLLPIHAWLGAAGSVPTALALLVPIGVLGGAGLALSNGLVDVERDLRTGRRAASVALGAPRTWLVQTVLLAVAAALAVVLAPGAPTTGVPVVIGPMGPGPLGTVRLIALGLGCACVALGALVLRSDRPGRRERGWELEALGVAALGIGFLAGTAAAVDGGGVGA